MVQSQYNKVTLDKADRPVRVLPALNRGTPLYRSKKIMSLRQMRLSLRHTTARHTSVDWTDPDVASVFPRLRGAMVNEVILRAGEVLYVPEKWVHAVVNIGVSAQCNRQGSALLRCRVSVPLQIFELKKRFVVSLTSMMRCRRRCRFAGG